jgi:hypothetical protein
MAMKHMASLGNRKPLLNILFFGRGTDASSCAYKKAGNALERTMSFLGPVPLLNIATTACIRLLVGSEICLTAFTNPVLREFDKPAQLKAAHLLTARLAIMHLWNVLGLVPLIIEAVVHRNERGFSLFVAASACGSRLPRLPLRSCCR